MSEILAAVGDRLADGVLHLERRQQRPYPALPRLGGLHFRPMDRKGRVVIPSPLGLGQTMVQTLGLEDCVLLFSLERWARELAGAREASWPAFAEAYVGIARTCSLDQTTARILIPAEFREEIGLHPGMTAALWGWDGMAVVTSEEDWRDRRVSLAETLFAPLCGRASR